MPAQAFVEEDINALAAGDYLLVHEQELSSETDGSGAVATCTAEQARSLHIKHGGCSERLACPA